jgi:hypothetical protein
MSLTKVSYSMIQGEVVNVLDYGAVGDGVADDTAAFNNALAYIRAQPRSGTLYVPKCSNFYSVSSINATGFAFEIGNYLTIRGESYGSLIRGNTAGVAVLDCVGSSNIHLQDVHIGTEAGVSAQCGLLLSRTTVNTSSNGGVFQNVVMQGDFTIAACVSIGAEGSRWYAPLFQNTGSSGTFKRCGFYTTSTNTLGATSLYATLLTGISQAPNTDNSMYGPHFQGEAVADNSSPVVIENGGQWSFYSALVLTIGTGNKMVTYIPNANDNIFRGTITWHAPLFESAEYIAHYIKGYSGIAVETILDGVSQYNGYMNQFNGSSYFLVQGDAASGLPYTLDNCNFIDTRSNLGITPILDVAVISNGKYNKVKFNLPVSGFSNNVEVLNPVAGSTFGSQSFGVPIQTAGTAPPTTGYFPQNSIRWNETPAAAGFVGWVCTASGTPGTWKTFGAISA